MTPCVAQDGDSSSSSDEVDDSAEDDEEEVEVGDEYLIAKVRTGRLGTWRVRCSHTHILLIQRGVSGILRHLLSPCLCGSRLPRQRRVQVQQQGWQCRLAAVLYMPATSTSLLAETWQMMLLLWLLCTADALVDLAGSERAKHMGAEGARNSVNECSDIPKLKAEA